MLGLFSKPNKKQVNADNNKKLVYGVIMASTLSGKLKRSYSIIRSSIAIQGVSAWITDNFYIIDKHYRSVLADKKSLKYKELYESLKNYCEAFDYVPEPRTLISFLTASKRDYSYRELCAIGNLLSVCAITEISSSLSSRGRTKFLPAAVKMLISLSDPQFGDVIPAVWKPEKELVRREKGYERFDSATKSQYRELISEYAIEHRMSEEDAAKMLFERANEKSCPLGTLLFRPKSRHAVFWALTVFFVFCIIFGISCFAVGWLSSVLVIPFAVAASAISDQIVSAFVPAHRSPRLALERVPDSAKTLVTVASLMTGGKGDEAVFESLLKFRYMNPDDNIYFCLLADLPDNDSQYCLRDRETIEFARKKIDELNRLHGNRFCLFFRERTLNPSENRFGGWERKRGAVCELVSHIVNGDKEEYYGGDFIRDIRYILTLDSDTNLSVGSVREMLSVALHPVNRPVVENGKVVSGYGIIQPSVRTELVSAYKSGFSRLISGAGGADAYASASFLRSQTIFGSGNFCGKGLIDVSLFNDLVKDKLPEGIVLSHDVIEGSILRTLCASDIVLTDSTPGNTVSFFRRQHRWIRGDFQNLSFLRGTVLNAFSKLRLALTVLRHSSPIFTLSAIVVGSFAVETSGLALFLFAFAEFFIPSIFSLARFLFSGSPFACLRFFSKAYSMLVQTFVRLFFEVSSSCRRAVLTLHAFCLAGTRMLTRKKTLEWTTAAQTEKLSSTLGKYVLDGWFSTLFGLALLIFAIPPFIRFIGLLYFVYPLVSTVLSRPLNGGAEARPNLTEKQKKMLIVHASDMFRFYQDNVNEDTNFLPPDNIQLSPVAGKAMRTSPTNIGFYLVALLAARDLDMITSEELASRLDESLSVIERLEKYKGNLFNWYDISNLSVIGDGYVSTVDCGNFMVMLTALKEGLREYEDEDVRLTDLIDRCETLLENSDLTPFYDHRRELFRIGIRANEEKLDSGCYDLLMSEARMTAYYAVAASIVPKKHWQTLGRTLTHRKGYIGMKSWSGTSFEYLMPQLFLPLYRDCFIFESIAFSLMVQRDENPIWGVSESGFYSFDSEMNYQYKANGIQSLALRRIGNDERVISPYSTYLSLCVCGNSAIKNLQSLEKRGMYGKYGLYEAIDFNNDSGGICVKSYMAHHVGMSLVACLNAVSDNVFVRRFMADRRMGSANELLQEKIPVDAHVFDDDTVSAVTQNRPLPSRNERTETADLNSPRTMLLSRGNMAAVISDSGHIGLLCGERMIAHTQFDKFSLRFTPAVVFSRSGKNYGCAPLYGNGVYGFERGNDSASHIVSGKDFSGRVRYSMAKNCDCFVINTRAETLRKYDITFVFEPVLETKKRFQSHISFSRLFVESEYDPSRRILYFHRRSGVDGRHIFTVAVAPRDKDMSFSFLSNREGFSSASVSSPIDYVSAATDNKTGACIDPLCLVRAENAEGGRTTFLVTCGETKSECERNIRIARNDKGENHTQPRDEMTEKLLSGLIYEHHGKRLPAFTRCGIGDLWSKSISGDYPLAVIKVGEIAMNRTESVLRAFLRLARSCIRCELVFIVSEEDNYNRPVETSVKECCSNLHAGQYFNKNGGIFILRESETEKGLLEALINNASFFEDFSNGIGCVPEVRREPETVVALPQNASALPVPENGVKSGDGYFIDDSYVVDKSKLPDAPYSFVLTGRRFSTVVTQSSLGYTFFDNARERRLCSFFGDPRSLDNGERVFLTENGKKYDLCACSNKVVFEKGRAVYHGEIEGHAYTVTVTVPPKFPVKLIRVKYSKGEPLETLFEFEPVMGDSVAPVSSIETVRFSASGNECLMFRNAFGMTFPEGRGFAGVCGGSVSDSENKLFSFAVDNVFFLGACTTENGARDVSSRINRHFFERSLDEAVSFAESMVPPIKISTRSKTNDAIMNFFLPYQVAACRFYARGSFYQSGGAYGFRDQLQDSLALVYALPETVKRHIIRCCAHQYLEGCVMHWWHTRVFGHVNRGIKSKCSDDMLYLPFVTADYIEKTGDDGLLDIKVGYLESSPLSTENERYEQPRLSDLKESVYHHCLRALAYAEQRGKNGLLLMGSCDWNDAFSLVGDKGIGESVFTTLLFIVTAEKFIPIMEKRRDLETADHYRKTVEDLRKTVEERAFFNDRYARAICDDGTVLGISGCRECEIDILSQAFAALAGLDSERTTAALKLAFSTLYDRKNRIFKLFDPPFVNGKAKVGYIRGYVAGIRENGGQYSHGALWGALGCLAVGMAEEALLILDCINPASRGADKALSRKYKNEPYAVSADIYSGAYSGRGGWSWYTGAAAWYYRIMLENVLGLKFGAGQTLLSASPVIPFFAEITFGKAKLKITASECIKQPMINGETTSFPLELNDGEQVLELPIE